MDKTHSVKVHLAILNQDRLIRIENMNRWSIQLGFVIREIKKEM
jgi:hypothetical protein